ncbi:hypothetical protein EDB83DRAFT_2557199 [Lactarius deliciosus]|nr:hypothetical protein EDB83DRAFT_2557199 [Lactarius deliciosus]
MVHGGKRLELARESDCMEVSDLAEAGFQVVEAGPFSWGGCLAFRSGTHLRLWTPNDSRADSDDGECSEITMDVTASEFDVIAPSGLRVLLTAQRQPDERSSAMELRHVEGKKVSTMTVVLPTSVGSGFGAEECWTSGTFRDATCLDDLQIGKQIPTLGTCGNSSRSLESDVHVCGGNKAPPAKAGLGPCHQSPSVQVALVSLSPPRMKEETGAGQFFIAPPTQADSRIALTLMAKINFETLRAPLGIRLSAPSAIPSPAHSSDWTFRIQSFAEIAQSNEVHIAQLHGSDPKKVARLDHIFK